MMSTYRRPSEVPQGERHKEARLNITVSKVCRFLHRICELDADQPVTMGGGFVRDLLLGGTPNDIDLWLPSTTGCNDVALMINHIQERFRCPVNIVFSLNAHDDANPANYSDVSNHWVIEFVVDGYKFNVMRTMVNWSSPQQFYTDLMRNFDIDLCMFFIGWLPIVDSTTWRGHVIMPSHLKGDLEEGLQVNFTTWNQWRLQNTSDARKTLRNNKMSERYEISDHTGVIDRNDIVAVPVPISWFLTKVHLMPLPTNAQHETIEVLAEEDDPDVAPLPQPTQVSTRGLNPAYRGQISVADWSSHVRQAYVRQAQFVQPDMSIREMPRAEIEAIMARAAIRMSAPTSWS